MRHCPVLLREVLEIFEEKKLRRFFDGTLGAGGHAKGIIEAHPEIERYIGCDRDPRAHALAKETLKPWLKKIEFIQGNYADLIAGAEEEFDGFLIDIGVSSMQLDEKERGFSFQSDAPLDMRMDPEGELTAFTVVNRYSEKELARVIFEYGEETRSRKVAKAIVEARKRRAIRTTRELVDIIAPVATRGRLHPATLTFQAIRIEVNDELGQLKRGLEAALKKMSPGGRIVVISFHSLEDRIVKQTFKGAKGVRILTKKPLVPKMDEMRANPRARSAKLRAVEIL